MAFLLSVFIGVSAFGLQRYIQKPYYDAPATDYSVSHYWSLSSAFIVYHCLSDHFHYLCEIDHSSGLMNLMPNAYGAFYIAIVRTKETLWT